MGIFDEIRKTQTPKLIKGKVWLTMLIEYDTLGNAKVLNSFSKPAKDSYIKTKSKDKKEEPAKIKIQKPTKDKEDLFG